MPPTPLQVCIFTAQTHPPPPTPTTTKNPGYAPASSQNVILLFSFVAKGGLGVSLWKSAHRILECNSTYVCAQLELSLGVRISFLPKLSKASFNNSEKMY